MLLLLNIRSRTKKNRKKAVSQEIICAASSSSILVIAYLFRLTLWQRGMSVSRQSCLVSVFLYDVQPCARSPPHHPHSYHPRLPLPLHHTHGPSLVGSCNPQAPAPRQGSVRERGGGGGGLVKQPIVTCICGLDL